MPLATRLTLLVIKDDRLQVIGETLYPVDAQAIQAETADERAGCKSPEGGHVGLQTARRRWPSRRLAAVQRAASMMWLKEASTTLAG